MTVKKLTIKELNKRFNLTYPEGKIFLQNSVKCVQYKEFGKIYKHGNITLWDLSIKLNLMYEEDINIMKGWTKLSCGCWSVYQNPVQCLECRKILRDKTEEEIAEDLLWEC